MTSLFKTNIKLSFKELLYVSLVLLGVLLFWFWDLFTLKYGFISGDHKVQHYPWMSYLYSELHAGRFPLWTNLIGCGFPIFAEGQIAALYPVNLIIYGLLPISFDAAYNYSTIFHYLVGGIFFYVFCRHLLISRFGGFVATLIYMFGSTQGGYFYNMNSQKTCIWFPFVLFFLERFLKTRNFLYVLWIGIIFGIQINAGYLQIAFYSLVFSYFYYFIRLIFFEKNWGNWRSRLSTFISSSFTMGAVGLLIALPQILATWELTQFSSRVSMPESFAYVGSLPPQGILTLLFPFLDSYLGQEMYVGIFGILLLLATWTMRRKWSGAFWALFWMGLLAFLIALGQFSPFYLAIIKITHFHGFRVPSKVLYFLVFALAIFAGLGWDKIYNFENSSKIKKATLVFFGVTVIALVAGFFAETIIHFFMPIMKRVGAWILEKYYVGSPIHSHSLDFYLNKLNTYLSDLIFWVSLKTSYWMKVWLLLLTGNLLVGILFLVTPQKFKRFILILGFFFLAGDLYAYSFVNNIKSAWKERDSYLSSAKPFVEYLEQDKSQFRIYGHYVDLSQDDSFPLLYNLNMLFNIKDIGVYAPFAPVSHRNFYSGLGANNNSIDVSLAVSGEINKFKSLLDVSSVKYVISQEPLKSGDWKERMNSGEYSLYENPDCLPRTYWLPFKSARMVDNFNERVRTEKFQPGKEILFESQPFLKGIAPPDQFNFETFERVELAQKNPSLIEIRTNFTEPGWLFLSDVYYPGWVAEVDSQPVDILKANGIFRSVKVVEGPHLIRFSYKPFYKYLIWFPIGVLLIVIIFSFTLLHRIKMMRLKEF